MGASKSLNGRKTSNHNDGPPKKRQKKNGDATIIQKNPVMLLNELRPNTEYEISCSGPDHSRIFSASVTINGKTYTAEDSTKKKAKARVAEIILQCYVQLKDPSVKAPLMDAVMCDTDFSQDFSESVCSSDDFYSFESAVMSKVKTPHIVSNNAESAQSNPVCCLNRLKPGIKVEIVKKEGSPHSPTYTAQGLQINH